MLQKPYRYKAQRQGKTMEVRWRKRPRWSPNRYAWTSSHTHSPTK
jgi:hypothetical protein